MNQISFALTIAFLFATIATTFYNPNIKDDLVKELTIGELAVYFRITIMRRNIYLAGLFLGFLCALVYIYKHFYKLLYQTIWCIDDYLCSKLFLLHIISETHLYVRYIGFKKRE